MKLYDLKHVKLAELGDRGKYKCDGCKRREDRIKMLEEEIEKLNGELLKARVCLYDSTSEVED